MKRRRLPLLIAGGVVVVVAVVVAVTIGVTAGSGSEKRFADADLAALDVPESLYPTGFADSEAGILFDVTAGQELDDNVRFQMEGLEPAECATISLVEPLDPATDAESDDLLHTIANVSATDGEVLEGHARAYDTVAAAERHLDVARQAAESCSDGYGNDYFAATSIAPLELQDLPSGVLATGWSVEGMYPSLDDPSVSEPYAYSTAVLRRDNVVVRAGCSYGGGDSDGICDDWYALIAQRLADLA